MAETEGRGLMTPDSEDLRDATERPTLTEPAPVHANRQAEADRREDQATDAGVAENYDEAVESVADHLGVDRTLER